MSTKLMTLEELLNCSAAELQNMSDNELTQHLSKYFIVTRPDLAKEARQQNSKQNPLKMLEQAEHLRKIKRAQEIAKAMGIDLGI